MKSKTILAVGLAALALSACASLREHRANAGLPPRPGPAARHPVAPPLVGQAPMAGARAREGGAPAPGLRRADNRFGRAYAYDERYGIWRGASGRRYHRLGTYPGIRIEGYRRFDRIEKRLRRDFVDRRIVIMRAGQRRLAVHMPAEILFGLNSAVLMPQAREVIARIARDFGNDRGARVLVNGYTDTSGAREHNRQLSQSRADAVANALARDGIQRTRIEARGFGEEDLRVRTANGVREPANRRVEVVVEEGRSERPDRARPS
jgi:outer membrane protein OmpA-like peptidoglycan-associated protein